MKKGCIFTFIFLTLVTCFTFFFNCNINTSKATASYVPLEQDVSYEENIYQNSIPTTSSLTNSLNEDNSKFALKTLIVKGKFNSKAYNNVKKLNEKTTILKFDTVKETELAYLELLKNPNIKVYIDEKEEVRLSGNYSHFYNDWGYDTISIDTYMNYLEENNVANGKEVVVVVIDTGINTSHKYLKDRILKDSSGNYIGFAATNSENKVLTTYTYSGYEFEDDDGHGTHVAGIICNSTPSNVKILPVKLMSSSNTFTINTIDIENMFSKIADYSKTYNIACVNMSWGGYWTSLSFVSYVSDCIDDYLISNDILPIASAGNEDKNADGHYPSAIESVVCVSALRQNGSSATFDDFYSNNGSTVDVSAPGTSILSCGISSTNSAAPEATKIMSGTSMATPYTCAVAALLYIDPSYAVSPAVNTLRDRLEKNVVDLGSPGWDENYGYGMVSLKTALGNISYTLTNTTTTYDGSYHNISITNIGVSNYTLSYRFETETSYSSSIVGNPKFKNWTDGAKKIYFKISATGYNDTIGFGTLTINKAPIEISIGNSILTYGDTINKSSFSYTKTSGTIYSGDDLGISLNTTATSSSPVNSYPITGSHSNTNYSVTFTNGNLTINPRSVSISLSNQTSSYGDSIYLDPTKYTVTSGSIVNGDNLNLTLETDATISSSVASNYYIKLKSSSNSNYIVTATDGKYIITQKEIIITSNQTGIYGNTPSLNENDFSTNLNINKSLLGLTMSTNVTNETPVGNNYSITFALGNTNYTLSPESVGYYSVTRRPITISAKPQSCVYGSVNLDQTKYEITSSLQIVNGDDLNIILSTSANNSSIVGNNYSITISFSGSDCNNYNISRRSGVLTINPRPITITAQPQSNIYGETVSLDKTKYSITSGNIVNSDSLTVTLTTTANNKSGAGTTHPISISCTHSNYDITLVEGILSITQRPISIQINNQAGLYGSDVVLKNSEFIVTSSLKVVNGDNLNVILQTSATSLSNVGFYPITLKSYNNDNYIIENVVNGSFEIVKADIIVTLLDQESVYGENVSLNQSHFETNINVNKENLGLILTTNASKLSAVGGNYTITASSANSNMDITIINAKLIITPRPIDITIANQECTYGEIKINQNKYSLGQTVNGDTVNITLSTNINNTNDVGSYQDVIIASTDNQNYTLVQDKGDLKVNKKEITITLSNQAEGYYGNILFDSSAYTLSETPKSSLVVTLSTIADNNSNVGDYDITYSYTSKNYSLIGTPSKFTINPRPITIKIEQTCTYGDKIQLNNKLFSVTSSVNVVSGDDLQLNLSTLADNFSKVGDYTISTVCKNSNYDVEVSSAILKIIPRAVILSALTQDKTFTYGFDVVLDQTKYSVENLVNNDALEITLTTNASKLSNVGNYPIFVNYIENAASKNYNITTVNSTLSIAKREISITLSDQEFEYGSQITLKSLYTVTSQTKVVSGDNLNLVLTTNATSSSAVGNNYEIDILPNYNSNYLINVTKGKLTITDDSIVVTIYDQSFTYGDEITLNQYAYDIDDSSINKSVLGITLITNAQQYDSVGNNYEITLNWTNKNYALTINKGVLSITPKNVSITIENQSCMYGDVNLNQTKYTVSRQPLQLGESYGIKLISTANNQSASGTVHEINFEWSNKNYNITISKLGILSIAKRDITISSYQYGVYGDKIVLDPNNYSVTSQIGIVNNDDLGINFNCYATNKSNVGVYNLLFTYSNKNYRVNSNLCKYEITPRKLSLTTKQENEYGNPIVLDSEKYTLISGNIVNDDYLDLSLTTDASTRSNVGNYSIYLESHNPNYDITLLESQLVIKPRTLTIASNQIVEYGHAEVDNSNYLISNGSLAFKEDQLYITFTTNATKTADVGTYNLLMSYNNTNYNLTLSPDSSFVIVPRIIIIQLGNNESVFGDPIVLNNQNYTIINGSLLQGDVITLSLQTTATNMSNVGTYPIKCTYNNSNYKINFVNDKYYITKRPIIVQLQDQSTPHGMLFNIDQTKYTIVKGSIVNNQGLDVQIFSNCGIFAFYGYYELTAKSKNENYSVEVINAKILITPSYEDAIIVVTVLITIIVTTIVVIKHKKKQKINKKLFDKYIKW